MKYFGVLLLAVGVVGLANMAMAQAETVELRYLITVKQLIDQQSLTIRKGAEGDERLLSFGQGTCRLKAQGISDQKIISIVGKQIAQLGISSNIGTGLGKSSLQAARETGLCATVKKDPVKVEMASGPETRFFSTARRLMVERGIPTSEAQSFNETKLLRIGKMICQLRSQGRSPEELKRAMLAGASEVMQKEQLTAMLDSSADAAQQELCPAP
jgi:hypothetical protein